MPVFEEAARRLRGQQLRFGKVDATAQTVLAQRFDIKAYPQIKFVREGESRNYNGARTEEALVAFGRELNQPAVLTVSSVADWSELDSKYPVSAVFFGKAGPEKRMFESLAWRLQGSLKFLRVEAAASEVATAAGVNADDTPLVLLVTKHADATDASNRYAGPWVEQSLRDWLLAHKLPLISELDANNFDDVTNAGKRIVLAAVDKTGPGKERGAEFVESLYALAKQSRYRDAFVFASLDGVRYSKYVSQFGVPVVDGTAGALPDISALPSVVVVEQEQDYYYAPPVHAGTEKAHPIGSVAEVDAFLSSVIEGRAQLTGTIPWYNPSRYIKLLEKSMSKLAGWQVALVVGSAMVLLMAGLYWCCLHGLDSAMGMNMTDEEIQQLEKEKVRAAALAAKKDAASAKGGKAAAEADEGEEATDAAKQGGMRARKAKAGQ